MEDREDTGPRSIDDITFGGPAVYRIVVQGALADHWSARLGGLAITHGAAAGGAAQTILEGPVRDQAQLSGVLNTLYGLHLSIVRIEQLESRATAERPTNREPTQGE